MGASYSVIPPNRRHSYEKQKEEFKQYQRAMFVQFMDTIIETQDHKGDVPWIIPLNMLAAAYLSYLIRYHNHQSTVYDFPEHVHTMLKWYIDTYTKKDTIIMWGFSNDFLSSSVKYSGTYVSGIRIRKTPVL